jgi:hypothetical protein
LQTPTADVPVPAIVARSADPMATTLSELFTDVVRDVPLNSEITLFLDQRMYVIDPQPRKKEAVFVVTLRCMLPNAWCRLPCRLMNWWQATIRAK